MITHPSFLENGKTSEDLQPKMCEDSSSAQIVAHADKNELINCWENEKSRDVSEWKRARCASSPE